MAWILTSAQVDNVEEMVTEREGIEKTSGKPRGETDENRLKIPEERKACKKENW